MVESLEDQDVSQPHIEEPDLVDNKDYPGGHDPAAEGTLGVGGARGGPEVPDQGRTEAPGGIGDTAGAPSDEPL